MKFYKEFELLHTSKKQKEKKNTLHNKFQPTLCKRVPPEKKRFL